MGYEAGYTATSTGDLTAVGYQALKDNTAHKNHTKIIIWGIGALLTLPLALLEYSISCAANRGAVITLFAQRTHDDIKRIIKRDQ